MSISSQLAAADASINIAELHAYYLTLEVRNRDEARVLILRAAELGRQYPELRRRLSWVYLQVANAQVRQGETSRGFATLENVRSMTVGPQDLLHLEVAAAEAQMLLHLGQLAQVLEVGHRALAVLGHTAKRLPYSTEHALLITSMAEAALGLGDAQQTETLLKECQPDGRTGALVAALQTHSQVADGKPHVASRRLRWYLGDPNLTPEVRIGVLHALADAELWSNDPTAALATTGAGVALLSTATDSYTAEVLTLSMRACADAIKQGQQLQDAALSSLATRSAEVTRRAAEALNLGEAVLHSERATAEVEQMEWQAECARFRQDGRESDWWKTVGDRWQALGRPYRRSYARLRQAAALARSGLFDEARTSLQEAKAFTHEHQPLNMAITALSQSSLSRLHESGRRTTVSPATSATHQPVSTTVTMPHLTRREREIMHLLGTGSTSVAIAHTLSISPRTVTKHLEHIYAKLGCDNKVSALTRLRA